MHNDLWLSLSAKVKPRGHTRTHAQKAITRAPVWGRTPSQARDLAPHTHSRTDSIPRPSTRGLASPAPRFSTAHVGAQIGFTPIYTPDRPRSLARLCAHNARAVSRPTIACAPMTGHTSRPLTPMRVHGRACGRPCTRMVAHNASPYTSVSAHITPEWVPTCRVAYRACGRGCLSRP